MNKNIVLLLVGSLALAGCASKSTQGGLLDNSGAVKDELFLLQKDTIVEINKHDSSDQLEDRIIAGDDFNTTVSDLDQETQKELLENQLVLFNYDSNQIQDSMIERLKIQSQILKENPSLRVLLEGRTDERGTNTYNLVLGERRADAVKSFLKNEGVDSDQILSVSLGENEPLAIEFESDNKDKFWMLNRSVFFKFVEE